jgi:hypothetical protein
MFRILFLIGKPAELIQADAGVSLDKKEYKAHLSQDDSLH